ncbi:hypothetical protein HU200_031678 [Digitaria exilis]|uniref:DNA mismatch repair proteins mutS family domain-containing protein n=1 Tax=Digitaria exilis TaxID=1010633 RepID=A0A835BME8_9POAL|nr:hypothetical protein HU200_031678 [Digitaria exilis]
MHRVLVSSLVAATPRWLPLADSILRRHRPHRSPLPMLLFDRGTWSKPRKVSRGISMASRKSNKQGEYCDEGMLSHILWWKEVGDFYEAIGFDACILVEHAGLNPFGGLRSDSIPKAGCPVVNLRQTLDDLTRCGYSVCIVEEIQGPTQARARKGRFISGHAHPGSPYVFGLAEVDHDVEFPDPMPVVGISHSAKGYCLISILETMKTYSAEEGLTEEAVVTKLRICRYHHLYLHTSLRNNSSGTSRWGEFGEGGLLWGECNGKSFEWFDGSPTEELLCKVREIYGLDEKTVFRNVTVSLEGRPQPLYLGTATQIGVVPTEGIPSLLKMVLPSNCGGLPSMYVRDLLLNPPSFDVAAAIQEACRLMGSITCSIPEFTCMPAAKMNECSFISQRIAGVISLGVESDQAITSFEYMPKEFFNDMESSWKGRVKRIHAEEEFANVDRAAEALSTAVIEDFMPIISRVKSVMSSNGGSKGEICYAKEHEAVWFKGKRFTPNVWANTPGEQQIKQLKPATDSKGRKVGEEWFTTVKVENALNRYHEACDNAKNKVLELLRGLSSELQAKINILVFCSTLLVIAKALFGHVSSEARRRGWMLPTISPLSKEGFLEESSSEMELVGLFPYWLDVNQGNAILNDVHMHSLFVLTGPNGGGKSSMLRSVCAAALLGICGLMVPSASAVIPHFDSIMLHMKAYDSPADGKSSFQIEMSEIRALVSRATARSLVLIDEICRGTETAKGTCIAGSIIERLDTVGCLGIISTHLHGIFDLPLSLSNTEFKAMGTEVIDGCINPTWRLMDGICRESLAFQTARREGMPDLIIRRSEELYLTMSANNKQTTSMVHNEPSHVFTTVNGLVDKPDSIRNRLEVPSAFEPLRREVESTVTMICKKKLLDLYNKRNITELVDVVCVAVGAREQPPPSTVGRSSIYVIIRSDSKLYVGQTDDLVGRLHAHRSKEGMQDATILYVVVPGKSVACQLETLLINQLPLKGFKLINKADGKHRNFGISRISGEAIAAH